MNTNLARVESLGDSPKMEAPLTLYMYAREDQFYKIINEGRFRLSTPWATNDVTEGVAQGAVDRSGDMEKYGYICLSASCTSPAMWGYYAGRSTGVCLVFTFYRVTKVNDDEGLIDEKNPIFRVKYQKERGQAESGIQLMSIKSEDWAHEKEFRIMYKLNDAVCKSYDGKVSFYTSELKPHLSGVILGSCCGLKEEEVKGMLKAENWLSPHLGEYPFVKKARLSATEFEMEVDSSHPLAHEYPNLHDTIAKAYALITEFDKKAQDWMFHSPSENEFIVGKTPSMIKPSDDFKCYGIDAIYDFNFYINRFMDYLKQLNGEHLDICGKLPLVYQYFDNFEVLKSSFKRAASYIEKSEGMLPPHISKKLFNKLRFAQKDDCPESFLNEPVDDCPMSSDDLTRLLCLSLVGDRDYPLDGKIMNRMWMSSYSIQSKEHSIPINDALLCAMKGWNKRPHNIEETANEIIQILRDTFVSIIAPPEGI